MPILKAWVKSFTETYKYSEKLHLCGLFNMHQSQQNVSEYKEQIRYKKQKNNCLISATHYYVGSEK